MKKKRVFDDSLETQRVYYRHSITGDRAYAVVEDGQTRLRFDRPNENTTRRLDSSWEPESVRRPILRNQLWRISFESDKALCNALGLTAEAKRDWLNMKDEERISWGRQGPQSNSLRMKLWKAIVETLGSEAE